MVPRRLRRRGVTLLSYLRCAGLRDESSSVDWRQQNDHRCLLRGYRRRAGIVIMLSHLSLLPVCPFLFVSLSFCLFPFTFTDHISESGNAIASVRPSVSTLTFELSDL